jgi:hypothetical protein
MWRNDRTVFVDRLNKTHEKMVKIYNLCAESSMAYESKDIGNFPIGKF